MHSLQYFGRDSKPKNNSVFHTYHMKDLWSYSTPQRFPHVAQFFFFLFGLVRASENIFPSSSVVWCRRITVGYKSGCLSSGEGRRRCRGTGEDWAMGEQGTEEGGGHSLHNQTYRMAVELGRPPTVHDVSCFVFFSETYEVELQNYLTSLKLKWWCKCGLAS